MALIATIEGLDLGTFSITSQVSPPFYSDDWAHAPEPPDDRVARIAGAVTADRARLAARESARAAALARMVARLDDDVARMPPGPARAALIAKRARVAGMAVAIGRKAATSNALAKVAKAQTRLLRAKAKATKKGDTVKSRMFAVRAARAAAIDRKLRALRKVHVARAARRIALPRPMIDTTAAVAPAVRNAIAAANAIADKPVVVAEKAAETPTPIAKVLVPVAAGAAALWLFLL